MIKRRTISYYRRNAGKLLPQSILATLPGWAVAWSTGSPIVADLAATAGAVIMCMWFWRIIGNALEMFRFLRIGAAMLCALQNISWLASSFTHKFVLKQTIETSLRESTGGALGISAYAGAVCFITMFAAIMALLGSSRTIYRLEQSCSYHILRLREIRLSKLRNILLLLMAVEVVLIGIGVVGQRSTIVEGAAEGQQSLLTTIFWAILPFQILLTVLLVNFILGKGAMRYKFYWTIFICSIGLILFLYFNKGRSGFVFSILALGYWLAFFRQARPKFWKLAIFGMIAYPLLSQVLLFSNFIRSSDAGIDNWKGSAIEVVPAAWEKFRSSSSAIEEEKVRTAGNLATRPLVATPLALCIDLPSHQKDFMMGRNFVNSVVWAVPGPLFPNKTAFPIQEELLYQYFHIGDNDTADSLYLSSYTEFGWFGILVYPVIVWAFWLIACRMMKSLQYSPLISAMIAALFLQLFLLNIGEGSISVWIITFRMTIFVFLFWKVVSMFLLERKKRGALSFSK